jgi:predicted DNA-binding transcriptional regulator AlpA
MSNEVKARRIFSLREAGEELNASRSSLYKLIASGDLKVFKIGRAGPRPQRRY